MTNLRGRTLRATFLHAPILGEVEALVDALVSIDVHGDIAAVIRCGDPAYEGTLADAEREGRLVTLPAGSYVLPGLVDLHVHAPQYPQLGQALDEPLEVWLQKYTFPLEARYADLPFAARSYGQLVDDLLANGTTTALYFATIHLEATQLLVDLCLEKGQRALIGRVAMDLQDSCPDYYRDASPEDSVSLTRALMDYVRNHPDNKDRHVLPVVTPRFIPACSDQALHGLGQLAQECGCHVQTHCSESHWAHGYVLERHGMTDTDSLDRFGLVTRKSVLAHATQITNGDLDTLAARGAAIAHCPLSNAYFGDAIFPLRHALAKGVHVGLGTDISGGPTASILESARMAMAVSRILESGADPARKSQDRARPQSRIDVATAFHLATAGGGKALDLPIGSFQPGNHFDALLIDTNARQGGIRAFDDIEPLAMLEKMVHLATRTNIARVWVGGIMVSE